jgi:hypothetical protein
MPKRKAKAHILDDDINDGSGSDDEQADYLPRIATQQRQAQRMHVVPDEAISVSPSGQLRSTVTKLVVPASPSKKTLTPLNSDIAPPPDPEPELSNESWAADFSEFDAEYGPGLERGPRELRGSVRWLSRASFSGVDLHFDRTIPMSSGRAWIVRPF